MQRGAVSQALELATLRDWPARCFSPSVNLAPSIEVGLPIANLPRLGVTRLGIGKTSAMSMPQNRSLVGFLSLLNGILDPNQVVCESGTFSSTEQLVGLASASKAISPDRIVPLPPVVGAAGSAQDLAFAFHLTPRHSAGASSGRLPVSFSALSGLETKSIADRTAETAPRSSEGSAEVETNASVRPRPVREISLKLADSASTRVDIQLIERAGSLHVAVRTPDQELAKSLQANLGELVGRFETKGYKTESWTPAAPLHASVQSTETANNSGHSQDQSEQGGARGGQQQQQQGQPDAGRRQHARWMAPFDEILNQENASTTGFRMENQ